MACFNDVQVSESSNCYMITGRIDPFSRHTKLNFSEDKKYLIMTASHEISFDRYSTFHEVVRKFRIDDKYNLNSMQYHIEDNFITITIKAKHRSFCQREEAPKKQVTRKKKRESVRVSDKFDMIMSEGELLPRYVVERTTIDPEILQRKIEIPPDLYFSEIDEAYVQFHEDELEPCPEFERLIEEMSRKRLEEKLAEKKKLATSQSTSVPEDTDTSIRGEKPVGGDIKESEKKSAVKSEKIMKQKNGVQNQASKQQQDKGEKTDGNDSKEIDPQISPKVSKQQPDEGEYRDAKDSKETASETLPRAPKQQTDEGDKAQTTHSIKCTNSRGETVWIEIELEQKPKKVRNHMKQSKE